MERKSIACEIGSIDTIKNRFKDIAFHQEYLDRITANTNKLFTEEASVLQAGSQQRNLIESLFGFIFHDLDQSAVYHQLLYILLSSCILTRIWLPEFWVKNSLIRGFKSFADYRSLPYQKKSVGR